MSLTLFYEPYSQPSRAILTFIRLSCIPHQVKVVNLLKFEHKSPEFIKINPLGQVPAISDGDFFLNESEAIVLYLIDSRECGKEYYPEEPKTRALINQYMPYHHSHVRPKLSLFFRLVWFPQAIRGPKDSIRKEATDLCKQFEDVFLKNDMKYIAGDIFTIADMFAVNEFTQIYFATDMDFTKFPVLKKYIERCLENKVLYEINKELMEFPEMMKKYKESQAQVAGKE